MSGQEKNELEKRKAGKPAEDPVYLRMSWWSSRVGRDRVCMYAKQKWVQFQE
jgi:hypothetical protein